MMKKIIFLTIFIGFIMNSIAQTTYVWSGDTDGNWNTGSNWTGGTAPNTNGILKFDGNSTQTTMTNNLTHTNQYQIIFDNEIQPSRTINGTTENTFYEYSGNSPKIENASSVPHTINFPIKAGSSYLKLNPVNGDLIVDNTVNLQVNTLEIWGDKTIKFNNVISGTGNVIVKQNSIVEFNTANTYTGFTLLENGTLKLGASMASGIEVKSTATLEITGNNVTMKYLTLQSGTQLTIPAGKAVTITENLTNNSGNPIIIENGASLIVNGTTTGNITYKRTLTTNWHLVSSTVLGETFDNLKTNHTFATSASGNSGLGTYNTANDTWTYQSSTNNLTGTIANGTGMAVKLNAAGNISFTGTANATTINTSTIKGATGHGYNLVGNPFTSYINSKTLLESTNTTNLDQQTIWLWNGTAYITKVAADNFIVAPAQGFFVKASSNGQVEFNRSNQSHQTTDTFMRNNARPKIHLTAKKGTNERLTKLYYIDGTTKGFDNGYDGTMFGGTTYNFAVFTHLLANSEGKNYAVQSLPINYENLVIPVGLIAKTNDEITFSAEAINLPSDITIYLEDRANGVTTNLSEGNYKITLNADANGIGQFYLHTTSRPLSTTTVGQLEDVSIYKSASSTITIAGLQAEKATVNMYSILGKKVFSKTISSNGIDNINVPQLANGIYIVEVNAKTGKTSKKIAW